MPTGGGPVRAVVLMVGTILAMTACTSTAPHVEEQAAAPPPGAAYVGADACAACHDAQAASFASTIHAQVLDERRPESERGCEACHGPGGAHADAGGGKGVGGLRAFMRGEPGR